jgi:hypothetical protein
MELQNLIFSSDRLTTHIWERIMFKITYQQRSANINNNFHLNQILYKLILKKSLDLF